MTIASGNWFHRIRPTGMGSRVSREEKKRFFLCMGYLLCAPAAGKLPDDKHREHSHSHENQIDEDIKELRRDEIMQLQQEVSIDKSADMVGQVLECMIEGKIADDDAYVGRSYKDAPNVDGFVFVNTTANLMSGDIVKVHIDGALEYDLIGSLVQE